MGHTASIGKIINSQKSLVGNLKERVNLVELEDNGRTVL
jgi:hypothetical protein